MIVYKIRHKKTGLFSCGGQYPRFSKKGKMYESKRSLKCHITLVDRLLKYGREDPYHECEIVEYEIKENQLIEFENF